MNSDKKRTFYTFTDDQVLVVNNEKESTQKQD